MKISRRVYSGGRKIPRGCPGRPKYITLLKKSRHLQRWFLQNPWIHPILVFNLAAIRLQAFFRGCLKRIGRPKPSFVHTNKQLDKYLRCIERIKKLQLYKPIWYDGGFSNWCCVRLQAWWRMVSIRRRHLYKRRITNQIAVLVIQTAWRNHMYYKKRSRYANINLTEMRWVSALKIQLAWRSFCNKRIYKYFADLVTHKFKGAPNDLLRSIIPNEADLLDRAAGVHVRFRLGGIIFPPKIFFKIYTHRPLCDVNSFAPRNYANERSNSDRLETFLPLLNVHKKLNKQGKSLPTLKVGAKYFGTKVTTMVGMDEWYRRGDCESNPWRAISSEIVEDLFVPEWLQHLPVAPKQLDHFHYSRLKRKQDLVRDKKRRKREWMIKAYMLSAQSERGASSPQDDDCGHDRVRPSSGHKAAQSQLHLGRDKDKDKPLSLPRIKSRGGGANHSHLQSGSLSDSIVSDKLLGPSHRQSSSLDNEHNTHIMREAENGEDRAVAVAVPGRLHTHGRGDKSNNSNKSKTLRDTDDTEMDLVNWSLALDFDSYARQWGGLAVSMPSDVLPDKMYAHSVSFSRDVQDLY